VLGLERKREKSMKMYKGNEPDESWEEIVELREFYGSAWKLFVRHTDTTGQYVSVKLCATGQVEHKANYWLSWDTEKKKISSRFMVDAKLLKNNRLDLYNVVVVNLEAWL
jgi:hypothetical protein